MLKYGFRTFHSQQDLPSREKFFFFNFWLCWVFVAVRGLAVVAASRGYPSLRCAGFSLRWLLLLRSTGSRRARLSSCGARAQLLRGTWDLPTPGLEPVVPCAGRRILNCCATREVPRENILPEPKLQVFFQSLTDLGERNTQLQLALAICVGEGNMQFQPPLCFCMERGNTQVQPTLAILPRLRSWGKGRTEEHLLTVQSHRITKRPRPNCNITSQNASSASHILPPHY